MQVKTTIRFQLLLIRIELAFKWNPQGPLGLFLRTAFSAPALHHLPLVVSIAQTLVCAVLCLDRLPHAAVSDLPSDSELLPPRDRSLFVPVGQHLKTGLFCLTGFLFIYGGCIGSHPVDSLMAG